MRHVLFVDDEPRILEGLQRMLRPQRQHWEMSFASSGEAALKLLAEKPFDVIVTDMRMPGMDGATLLIEVRDRFPSVVRMVLTGYTSLESAVRAIPVAHQFMVKPCDPSLLQVTVERACSLKALMGSDTICQTVGAMRELPSLPRTYGALVQALSNPDASLDGIARIVEKDVAVSARILQLVNSPLFGISRRIANIRTAVSFLGVDILKNLVLSAETFRAFGGAKEIEGCTLENVHAHAHLTARICRQLPMEKQLKEVANLAALLHDVGRLVLMTRLPDQFAQAVQQARQRGASLHEMEQEVFRVTHAEIGAYLLGLWGLPFPIIEAVAYHHCPSQVPHQVFDCLAAVHVADVLARMHEMQLERARLAAPQFDMQYLGDLGVTDQVEGWQSMAADVARQSEA